MNLTKRIKILKITTLIISVTLLSFSSCKKSNNTDVTQDAVVIEVNPSYFLAAGLRESITKVNYTLTDGSTVECYKIVSNSKPTDHTQGPWCPTKITDGADKGGIWFEGGKIYDVTGTFIQNLSTFYNDAKWKLYNTDGSIKVTTTQTACEAAARPNVDAAYNNYCVECQPSYFESIKSTYYIPVKPVKTSSTTSLTGMGKIVGLAFNGINFDPPAPTAAILGAYTIAPMDDAGGHVNPLHGYHYHAATGKTTEIAQADGHASMIGYAMDGYGLFKLLDPSGKEATDLDSSRGHYDSTRGYHYHVASSGSNSFITSFRGATGGFEVK
jgi:hypothetical protein